MDAGLAAFIALLDNGRTGRAAELHAAVVDGYLDGVETLDDEGLAAWTVVAGLQFVQDRFVRPLRPDRTAQLAAEVLSSLLDRV